MNLTEKVKTNTIAVLKDLQPVTNSLKTGRGKDVFSLVTFDYQMEASNFAGNSRLKGQFDMQFLVSPMDGHKQPLSNYDEIVAHFESHYSPVFENDGVRVLFVNYGSSTLVTDPITGSSSIVFSINIDAIEKKKQG